MPDKPTTFSGSAQKPLGKRLAPNEPPPARMLTMASGGWVLLAALILTIAAAFWLLRQGRPAIGERHNPESYQFNLSNLLVPRGPLVAALNKDALSALDAPKTQSVAQAGALTQYARYLYDESRVIGVTINGEARCYPLAIMQLHEICNDTIAGVPVVVTYSPLTDSVVVARREVGGQTREFGGSGLLYNSSLVMYDRQPQNHDESLWYQLQWRAIAGPAADKHLTLDLLPCEVVTWKAWRTSHPNGRVITGLKSLRGEYPRRRYQTYLSNAQLYFPVEPQWQDPVIAGKTPIAAVGPAGSAPADGQWKLYLLPELAKAPAAQREKILAASPVPLIFDAQHATLAVAPGAHAEIVYALLFGWYAAHPNETHGHLAP